MDDNALIRIRHVRKVYLMGEEKVVALDDVSLDIYKGEFVCFLGTSGSGKSTFLNMVAGLEKPTRGEVWIGKVPIHKLNEAQVTIFRQKNIGFIFQAYHLMPSMTALENVALPLLYAGVGKEERLRRAAESLRQVGLALPHQGEHHLGSCLQVLDSHLVEHSHLLGVYFGFVYDLGVGDKVLELGNLKFQQPLRLSGRIILCVFRKVSLVSCLGDSP